MMEMERSKECKDSNKNNILLKNLRCIDSCCLGFFINSIIREQLYRKERD
jgi:hypothetical protein